MSLYDETQDSTDNLDELAQEIIQAGASASIEDEPDPEETPASQRPDWVPEKFWDASTGQIRHEEMARSYANLESQYGALANDLGTQRKLTDQLLDLKRSEDLLRNGGNPSKPAIPEIKGVDLLDDPVGSIDKVVSARIEAENAARQAQAQQEAAQQRRAKFDADHAGWQTTVSTEAFKSWLNSSPARQRLAAYAAQEDFDAADALLTEYKAQKQAAVDAKSAENKKAASKVSLEGTGGGGGIGATSTGKVYKRAAILRMMMERPEEYQSDAFQAEIQRAYAEGRVK